MPSNKILVTAVGGDIGQSVIKCLKDGGYAKDILGCDVDNYAAGKICVNKFYQSPWVCENRRYFSFIKKLIKEEKVRFIFPINESEIDFFDKEREYFFRKGIKVFINKHDIIKTFSDKYEMVVFLKNHNLTYPKTFLIDDYNYELCYPFLLKPRKGCGGRGQIVINNKKEFEFYRRRFIDSVVQEIISNRDEEYTMSVFAAGGKFYSIVFRRYLGYGSLTKVAELVQDKKITLLAEKIVKATALQGVLNIQLRKVKNEYVPFEINPRISSTVYIRHYFGFCDVLWWLKAAEDKKITYTLKYKSGVGVRSLSEVFFDLKK